MGVTICETGGKERNGRTHKGSFYYHWKEYRKKVLPDELWHRELVNSRTERGRGKSADGGRTGPGGSEILCHDRGRTKLWSINLPARVQMDGNGVQKTVKSWKQGKTAADRTSLNMRDNQQKGETITRGEKRGDTRKEKKIGYREE